MDPRLRPTTLLSLALAAALAGAAGDGLAQPRKDSDDIYDEKSTLVDQASEQFNRGVELSRKGEVAQALEAFQKAYDLVPNWKILYNIGQTSAHQKDNARALRALSRYLAEGGAQVGRPRKAEVEREIARLRPTVGNLEITVSAPGARVEVDGLLVGMSPMSAKVPANPGRRRVTAKAGNGETASVDVTVEVGAGHSVDLKLGGAATVGPGPTATATGTAPPPPPPNGGGNGDGGAMITKIAWIAAGVFTAGAIATGTIAVLQSEDLADSTYAGPDNRPADDSDLAGQASLVDTMAIVTDVLVGAAILTGGAAIYLTIAGPPWADKTGAAPPSKKATDGAKPSAMVRVGPRGLSLTGTF